MNITPLNKTSFAEQIAASLRKEIITGNFKPGEKLPSERDLAQQFGTNRNTLREAIRFLEGLKLVSVRQGDGVKVKDFRTEGEMIIVPYFIIESEDNSERVSVLAELLALRRLILGEAAALAADRAKADDINAIKEHLKAISSVMPNQEIAELDLEFYRLLVFSSHSLISIWMFNTFISVYIKAMPIVKALWVTPQKYLESLEELIAALNEHKPEKASKIIIAHLKRGDDVLLGKLMNNKT